ncbi:MAG: hypothetical protein HY261_05590 [Chloroflexi bacterium]|nr:hypothetical protein [Chloroflexota bacterium]
MRILRTLHRRRRLTTLLGFAVLGLIGIAAPAVMGSEGLPVARTADSPPASQAVQVRTGMYMLNVGRLDTLTGTYNADFYLVFECDRPCDPGNFEFSNGRATALDKQGDDPNGKTFRVQASFNTDVDFRNYPFDKHKLLISLEDKLLTKEQLQYVVDPKLNAIDDHVIVGGWELHGWDAIVTDHYYPVFDETYSRYEFFIHIQRGVLAAILKSLLPALVIVLGGFLGFLLGPDKALQRLTIATAALTGAILFHVNLTSQVPPVGSLTYADKFMIVNYVGLVGALAATVAILILTDRKQEARALRIHRGSRLTVPIVWVVLQGLVAWTLM